MSSEGNVALPKLISILYIKTWFKIFLKSIQN